MPPKSCVHKALWRSDARAISKKKSRLQTHMRVLWPIDGVDEPPQLLPHEINVVNRLFKVESKLITSTADNEDLPEWSIPEVAFAGRSNVGKSSLINALTGQSGLVRTSKTPGRTQKLHFFSVGGKIGSLPDMSLVDMPGYGFATAPKKVVDQWHDLVGGYVEQRRGTNLKVIYLLVDSRRGISAVDENFMDFLQDLGMIYQVVLTKADTVRLKAAAFFPVGLTFGLLGFAGDHNGDDEENQAGAGRRFRIESTGTFVCRVLIQLERSPHPLCSCTYSEYEPSHPRVQHQRKFRCSRSAASHREHVGPADFLV